MKTLAHFIRRLPSLLAAIALLTLASARAQVPSDDTAFVQARIYCLAVSAADFSDLSFLNGRTEVPLAISRDFLSPAYDYHGPRHLVILRKLPPLPPGTKLVPTADGLPPDRAPAISLDIPPAGGEFLLLFGRSATGLPQAMLVDYSTADVPLGSYLVWNLSTRTLGLQLEQNRTLISPGQHELVKLTDSENTYMPLKVFDQAHGQVFGSRHLHRPQTRQLIFLTDLPDHPDRISLRMITQTTFSLAPSSPSPSLTVVESFQIKP